MRSAVQLVTSRLGAVDDERAVDHDEEPCAICGGQSVRGVPIDVFIGDSLTDQNTFRAPTSRHVCVSCAFVRARFSPVPGRPPKEGKENGGRWGNYSHFVDDNRLENASKGEKPRILAWLRGPKAGWWGCGVADSGQKHVLPYVPLNPPGARGRIRFEEAEVALPTADGWRIVDDMIAMLTAGATKAEIESGAYSARAWQLCGDAVRAFEGTHGRLRGGSWFALALWLSQRNEERVQERMAAEAEAKKEAKSGRKTGRRGPGAAADAAGGDAAGVSPRVPSDDGREGARALADHPGSNGGRGELHAKRRRVGDEGSAVSPGTAVGQLDMFAALGAVELGPGARRVAGHAATDRQGARAARGARKKSG